MKPRTAEPVAEKSASTSSSIFGGARPVDTASKEREIEKRLERLRLDDRGKRESRDRELPYRERERRASQHSSDEEEINEPPSDDLWKEDGIRKDRPRVMRPDLLSEEEKSPRERSISESSNKSLEDSEGRSGRVILRKSLSRESKDSDHGRDKDDIHSPRGDGSGRGSGRGKSPRGRGESSAGRGGRTDKDRKRDKPVQMPKFEEPKAPVS